MLFSVPKCKPTVVHGSVVIAIFGTHKSYPEYSFWSSHVILVNLIALNIEIRWQVNQLKLQIDITADQYFKSIGFFQNSKSVRSGRPVKSIVMGRYTAKNFFWYDYVFKWMIFT